MKGIYYQEEKLNKCAHEIERLQKELSEQMETNADLQFQLSTLRFLEQQSNFDNSKIDEVQEEREKEKAELINKLHKSQRETQEQKDLYTELLQQLKQKEGSLHDLQEKLKLEQARRGQDNENSKKEILIYQNELRVLRQLDGEDKGTPKLIRTESLYDSPNIKLKEKEDKFLSQIQELQDKLQNESNDKKRLLKDRSELIREWQTKYDQVIVSHIEKEDSYRQELEDKVKEIQSLQYKLYQNYTKDEQIDQEQQTDTVEDKNRSTSFSFVQQIEDEKLQNILEMLSNIEQSQNEQQLDQLCKHSQQENTVIQTLKHIINIMRKEIPQYVQIQLLNKKMQVQYLEKQLSIIYYKWKEYKDNNQYEQTKLNKKRSQSVQLKLTNDEIDQLTGDAKQNLIKRLRNRNSTYKAQVSDLEATIIQLKEEQTNILSSFESQLNIMNHQIEELNNTINEQQENYSKLKSELVKSNTHKQNCKIEIKRLNKDLQQTFTILEEKNNKCKELIILQNALTKRIDTIQGELETAQKRNLELVQEKIVLEKSIEQLEQENFEAEQKLEQYFSKAQLLEQQSPSKQTIGTPMKKTKTLSYIYKGVYD